MRIALYQPDIPQNTGTILRMAACLGVDVDLIGPAGFPSSDRALRRAGLDYLDHVRVTRHQSWQTFLDAQQTSAMPARVVLATTKAHISHTGFAFASNDILLFGRESAGVPLHVADACDHKIRIPMRENMRSLNVAMSVALVTGEALRQTGAFPNL